MKSHLKSKVSNLNFCFSQQVKLLFQVKRVGAYAHMLTVNVMHICLLKTHIFDFNSHAFWSCFNMVHMQFYIT